VRASLAQTPAHALFKTRQVHRLGTEAKATVPGGFRFYVHSKRASDRPPGRARMISERGPTPHRFPERTVMKNNLFALTPRWIMFDQFWLSLKKRNLWLIYLRYGAVAMLLGMTFGSLFLPGISISTAPLTVIAVLLLAYNLLMHKTHDLIPPTYAKFHGLHFALIQIIADLLTLAFIIYFTGGVESPFFPIFIFHVIIGSLLLPAAYVSLICAGILTVMLGGAIAEIRGALPHHPVEGLLAIPLYTNQTYVILHFLVFTLTIFVSSYLANSISKELYLRERSLTNAYAKLENAERTKSRYVMSVVHDLKTPIAAVTTYLNMILERTFGPLTDEMERPLERSRVRLNGAITLINDILQLSQVKLTSKIEVSEINLVLMIDEIYQEMRIMFMAKRVRFSTWVNDREDLVIEAEPKLLRLALSNIISNAQKYTEENGAVEVHMKAIDDTVVIEVADSGIGIPENEISRVFEDFYRTTISKKKSFEGTGLGLSIVQQIVHQLHGTIRAESPSRLQADENRKGTAFFLSLPRTYEAVRDEFEEEEED
jgi:signal transduction histidine kinase